MFQLCPAVINCVCVGICLYVCCATSFFSFCLTQVLIRLCFLVFVRKLYYKLKNVRLKLIGKTVMLVLKSEYPFY